ncbi:DUF3225 domain-containing protein [Paraburkholderia oxyphila]|uniref:DUF3225 domain-containing protein n=1 Tax=Paraburkholderia oxyphila TaxID=614212 RepID=UPI001FE0FD5A|nr:DUF3225 domain-containing protein [Paraburkholderia oxyphila]
MDAYDAQVNAYTAITRERALAAADALDARRARGEALPPLAGALLPGVKMPEGWRVVSAHVSWMEG